MTCSTSSSTNIVVGDFVDDGSQKITIRICAVGIHGVVCSPGQAFRHECPRLRDGDPLSIVFPQYFLRKDIELLGPKGELFKLGDAKLQDWVKGKEIVEGTSLDSFLKQPAYYLAIPDLFSALMDW